MDNKLSLFAFFILLVAYGLSLMTRHDLQQEIENMKMQEAALLTWENEIGWCACDEEKEMKHDG